MGADKANKRSSKNKFDEDLEGIAKAKVHWAKEVLEPHQKKHPDRTDEFMTVSSKPIARLYTPLDIPDINYMKDLGFPSEYPFTRGVQPTMYRGRLWTMRQFAGMGNAEESGNCGNSDSERFCGDGRCVDVRRPAGCRI